MKQETERNQEIFIKKTQYNRSYSSLGREYQMTSQRAYSIVQAIILKIKKELRKENSKV